MHKSSHFREVVRPWRAGVAALCLLLPTVSMGEVLGSVDVKRTGDEAVIRVHFNLSVHYLRHFPTTSTDAFRIFVYMNPQEQQDAQDQDREYRKSPSKSQVPPFTITYLARESSLLVEFKRPLKFSVADGKHGRSIVITLHNLGKRPSAK
jgi:hypothetical protein